MSYSYKGCWKTRTPSWLLMQKQSSLNRTYERRTSSSKTVLRRTQGVWLLCAQCVSSQRFLRKWSLYAYLKIQNLNPWLQFVYTAANEWHSMLKDAENDRPNRLTPWSPCWKAASRSVTQEFRYILRNPKDHYRVHTSSPLFSILKHNPVHITPSYFSRSIWILSSPCQSLLSGLFPSCFPTKKINLSLQQDVEAHRVLTCRDSHIFYTISSQMAVRLSALRSGRPFPREDSWYSFLLEAESIPGP
jgi:hypothetical protein